MITLKELIMIHRFSLEIEDISADGDSLVITMYCRDKTYISSLISWIKSTDKKCELNYFENILTLKIKK